MRFRARRFSPVQLLSYALLALTLGLAGCSAKRADIHQALRTQSFQAPQGSPMLLAAYQPWFGRPGHINVGYNSQDRVVLQRQVQEAKNLGIRGFVVNWYGARKPFEDHSYAVLQEIASQTDFKVAIMYDEDVEDPGQSTDKVVVDLQYAYDRYISPSSGASRNAYLRYNGRPVIFIFPKGGGTDWDRVRRLCNSWEEPPLLIMKDIVTRYADAFDGYYAWVQPGQRGWSPDGSNWGRDYLDNFYLRMSTHHPDKIAVGAAWPGFDDSRASWTRHRRMSARCGKTFEESLRMFRRYYNDEHPLPFLMIVTWNDYEEGTAIERGYANCSGDPAKQSAALASP